MSQLSRQSIRHLSMPGLMAPLIKPFLDHKEVINGKSAGLSSASYDMRIDHDLTLGVNPAIIFARQDIGSNPPYTALAYTMEDLCLPNNVAGRIADKSTYARQFLTVLNTFIDPGFHGNITLELVNHGPEPVILKKGDPICQVIFTFLDEPTDLPYRGKYQHQAKVAQGPRYEVEDGSQALEDGRTTL